MQTHPAPSPLASECWSCGVELDPSTAHRCDPTWMLCATCAPLWGLHLAGCAEVARLQSEKGPTFYVLVRSDQGDGGWSLHAAGSSGVAIAEGLVPPLACGPATYDELTDEWDRPDASDYAAAERAHIAAEREAHGRTTS